MMPPLDFGLGGIFLCTGRLVGMVEGTNSILPASSLDRRLISSAAKHHTPEQMSEAVLGKLTPAQCVDRVKVILSSRDVWTEIESRQLLMSQMQDHLTWLQENRENEKVLSSIPRMYKLVSESLDKSRINLDEVTNRINDTQARLLVSAIDAIVSRLVAGLIKHGVDVEETMVWAEVEQAMPIAIGQVDAARSQD